MGGGVWGHKNSDFSVTYFLGADRSKGFGDNGLKVPQQYVPRNQPVLFVVMVWNERPTSRV